LLTADVARQLKAARVATVLVDVWGASAGTHEALTRRPGSFAASLAGVQAALAAGLRTQMLTILNRRNVGELQRWVDLAHAVGVRTVGVLRPYPIGRLRRAWSAYALALPEMMTALRGLKPPADMHVMQSWHPRDANCCWQMAAVNAWGDSIGCAYLREFVNYGNVLERSLRATWEEHPLYRRLRAGEVSASCGACTESQGSRGGCRSTAFAFHGQWDAPDPFDEGINHGVDLRVLPDWMRDESPRPPAAAGPGDGVLRRLQSR
jgi:radical SAM protein with 4Fe4S-binding SPASM domain